MGERAARGPESISAISSFALGMTYAFALSSLKTVAKAYGKPVHAIESWPGWVITAVIVALPLIPRLRRVPYVVLFVVGFVPIAIGSSVAYQLGFDSPHGYEARSLGAFVAFVAEFAAAVWYLRQQRELDREIFRQSGLIAFIATIGAGVAYGVAEGSFGTPHLSPAWLALFGLTVFVVCLATLERRYT
jgi:hypothetical protein